MCQNYGVEKIFILSVLPRESFYYQLRRKELNDILRERCQIQGFIFVDNSNIILKNHIGYDGTHLNKVGSSLLCRNLQQHLDGSSVM